MHSTLGHPALACDSVCQITVTFLIKNLLLKSLSVINRDCRFPKRSAFVLRLAINTSVIVIHV